MIFKSLFIKGTCMSMPSMNAVREAEDFVVAISSQVVVMVKVTLLL